MSPPFSSPRRSLNGDDGEQWEYVRKLFWPNTRPFCPINPRETRNIRNRQFIAYNPGTATFSFASVATSCGGLGASCSVVASFLLGEAVVKDLVEAFGLAQVLVRLILQGNKNDMGSGGRGINKSKWSMWEGKGNAMSRESSSNTLTNSSHRKGGVEGKNKSLRTRVHTSVW